MPDVGPIHSIEFGHDDEGMNAAWFVAWVRVTNSTTGASAYFTCDSWFSKKKGDGSTRRMLNASKVRAWRVPEAS